MQEARQADHDTAVAALDELNDRLDSGDDTVTDADLDAARAKIDRTTRLVTAAGTAVAVARAAVINDDPQGADEIADVLAELYGTLVSPTVVTSAADATPRPKGAPALYVVQTAAGTNDGGALSGVVDVVLHRGPLLAALDADELAEACHSRGHLVDVTDQSGSTPARKRTQDTLRVRVHSAFPSVPVLDVAPDAEALRYFGQGVAERLVPAITHHDDIPRGFLMAGDRTPSPVVTLVNTKSGRVTKGPDGITRQEVTFTISAQETSKYKGNAMPAIRATLGDNLGRAERNVGRVESMNEDITVPEAHAYRRNPWNIVVTFTLAYRTS